MMLFVKVFGFRSSTIHKEAMLAIGALAYATFPQFVKNMAEFYKYLEMSLLNFEYQVCAISVGVVGDICRALDYKVVPFCDGIMTLLLSDFHIGVDLVILFHCFPVSVLNSLVWAVVFWRLWECPILSLLFRDENVSKVAVRLLGDLADTLGPKLELLFKDKSLLC
ncbi:hypothetical protein MKX03_014126 [Papaver bracteatum]|nr:hypothetical protein MKX03_014126 [Papaver bracteatum]